MQKARSRKRPCKICRKWFMPDPRQVGRQKTCGDPLCQKENHRRQCARWNRKNRDYFKANYLSEKLAPAKDPPPSPATNGPIVLSSSRIELGLPRDLVAEIIGVRRLIVLEYILLQVMGHGKRRSSVRGP